MDFTGDIVDVERLLYDNISDSDAVVTISGANAAGLSQIGSTDYDGSSVLFSVQLAADSTTDLSAHMLVNADEGDRIRVSSSGGNTAVQLSAQIGSFIGSADSDQVGYALGGGYRDFAQVCGGAGDDRIMFGSSAVIIDGGSANDTLAVVHSQTIDFSGVSSANCNILGNNFENVDASASFDRVSLCGREDIASVLIGGRGSDVISSGGGADSLSGGGGDDVIDYALGLVGQIDGGSGNDTIKMQNFGI